MVIGDRPVDSRVLLSTTVPYIINKQIMNKRICFLNHEIFELNDEKAWLDICWAFYFFEFLLDFKWWQLALHTYSFVLKFSLKTRYYHVLSIYLLVYQARKSNKTEILFHDFWKSYTFVYLN